MNALWLTFTFIFPAMSRNALARLVVSFTFRIPWSVQLSRLT